MGETFEVIKLFITLFTLYKTIDIFIQLNFI